MKPSSQAVQNLLKEISSNLGLAKHLTPLNLKTEREKFFQNRSSNPTFAYPEIAEAEIKEIQLQLQVIEIPDDGLDEYVLQKKLTELKLETALLLHLDSDHITDISLKLYKGKFSLQYQELAEVDGNLAEQFGALETLTGEETVVKVAEYLANEYNQTDWDVSVSDQGDFYVRVQAPKHKIMINRQINWDFTDLDAMLAHEIDGHVLRFLNSQKRDDPLLRSSFPYYIVTEEGLASFLGDYCTVKGKLTLKHHALKYLAGILAQTASFRAVYIFLMDHGFTEALAFQRTFRLKRGLKSTVEPGCFAKEALYYEGLIDVKEYIDGEKDIQKLFSGKFGLSDLVQIPEQTDVILPKRLQTYLAQKKDHGRNS